MVDALTDSAGGAVRLVGLEKRFEGSHAVLVRSLAPLDRQLILLHLEGLEPSEIAEVPGLTKTNVTTKVHRIKALLAKRFGLE